MFVLEHKARVRHDNKIFVVIVAIRKAIQMTSVFKVIVIVIVLSYRTLHKAISVEYWQHAGSAGARFLSVISHILLCTNREVLMLNNRTVRLIKMAKTILEREMYHSLAAYLSGLFRTWQMDHSTSST